MLDHVATSIGNALPGGGEPVELGDVRFFEQNPGSGWIGEDATIAYTEDLLTVLPGTGINISQFIARTHSTSGFVSIAKSVFVNGAYYGVGNSGRTAISKDGRDFLIGTIIAGVTFSAIAFGAGVFVAGTTGGRVFTSPNFEVWTERTSPFSGAIGAIAYGAGLFVAVGAGGVVATSPDGETWTTRSNPFGTNFVRGVDFENGLFLASSDTGVLATSTTGTSWTSRTSNSGSNPLYDFKFGAGLYVGVGNGSRIITSPTGATWTSRTNPFTGAGPQSIDFVDGIFIAAGSGGQMASSPDGISWTLRDSGLTQTITSVCAGSSQFLLQGNNNAVSSSVPLSLKGIAVVTKPIGKASHKAYTRIAA